MSVLESFCGLKVCADIKHCLLVTSFTFEKSGIQEVYFFVEISAVNLIGSGGDCLLAQTLLFPFCQHSTARISHQCIFSTLVVEKCRTSY